jgi:hypothetical protein
VAILLGGVVVGVVGGLVVTRRTALVRWLREPRPMKSDTLVGKAKVTLVAAVIVAGTFGIPYVLGWWRRVLDAASGRPSAFGLTGR